jgi:8-oxo-dGTP pyrophosphatase MutT (NUDIX family)
MGRSLRSPGGDGAEDGAGSLEHVAGPVEDEPGLPEDVPGSTAQVRRLVAEHETADAREAAARLRILGELDRREWPCDRAASPVHVTASGVVIGQRGTVLHLHRRLGRWLQPGGHIDPGESPWSTALRESEEETGLLVEHPPGGPDLLHVDVHPALDHTHLDLRFLLIGPDQDPHPPAGESPEARWFSWEEAESVADEALVGALRAARRRTHWRPASGTPSGR